MKHFNALSYCWDRFKKSTRFSIPAVCALCKIYYQGTDAICEECYTYFKPLKSICSKCALPFSIPTTQSCMNCAKEELAFDQTITVYSFEEPLRTLLRRYKYHGALYLRSIFIRLMCEAYIKREPQRLETECLIPVPMHRKKLRSRGFNQAAEFAKALGKHFAIPYQFQACKRLILTESQVNSSAMQRRQNLLNAFKVKKLPYKHVTLVDDVMTTGSTANALARLLKKQGVEQVNVWCCARTVPRS